MNLGLKKPLQLHFIKQACTCLSGKLKFVSSGLTITFYTLLLIQMCSGVEKSLSRYLDT